MLILGIETATPWGTIALYDGDQPDGEVNFEISLKIAKGGGEYLLALLPDIMTKIGCSLNEVDLIAVGTGPGSYTGIRVGLAAVKGLAEGLQKPTWGINTLRIIAENARYAAQEFIASVIDARHNQIYAALYQKVSQGLQELESPQFISVQQFANRLSKIQQPVLICGDGSKVYQTLWQQHNINIAPRDWDRPLAGKVAMIAFREFNNNSNKNCQELLPSYLQRVEAEIRLEEKLHATTNHQPDEG